MISEETKDEIVKVVKTWADKHGLFGKDLCELFQQLSMVKGNQSFRQSMRMLYEEFLSR